MSVLAVGVQGLVQQRTARQQAERERIAGEMLVAVVDAQHTASVVLADAYILDRQITADERRATGEQMTEHAEEMVEHLDVIESDAPRLGLTGYFADFVTDGRAVVSDAAAIHANGDRLTSAVSAAQSLWDAFDVSSDDAKTKLADLDTAATADAEQTARRAS